MFLVVSLSYATAHPETTMSINDDETLDNTPLVLIGPRPLESRAAISQDSLRDDRTHNHSSFHHVGRQTVPDST